ncbi:DUF3782 domain-containing protein [Sulfolobus tengchongensis]|uniref:DUF3782 domain-containing protein n=1 Tax=Sulfolobus tengchongensis TaxID=207809 RepID=A0AAX4L2W0_9CREN
MELKDQIIRLIKEDAEFRKALTELLGLFDINVTINDLKEILKGILDTVNKLAEAQRKSEERLSKLEENMALLAEAQKRTEEKIAELVEAQKRTEERLSKLEEAQRKSEEKIAELAEAQRKSEERLSKLEENMALLAEAQKRLFEKVEEMDKDIKRLDKTLSNLGNRWGVSYEYLIRNFFAEVLKQEGIDVNYLNRFTYKDDSGTYGLKGTIYEIDILAKDSKVYLIEVKSRGERDDIEWFNIKCEVLSKVFNFKNTIKMFLAVSVDNQAIKRAEELGIKLIYGEIYEVDQAKT